MATATNDITETIELARGGSTEAFGRIVRQYQSLVSGVLFSATGDFHRSEDLTQETFLIAWNKLGELRETENLAAWLCSIARNLAHRSKRGKTANMVHGSLEDETASSEPGPETELLRREQSELVWSAIGDLDEPYRETLVLYYRSGQSVKEIAAATQSSEESVRQRLVRARKSLKSKLETIIGDILTETAPGDVFTFSVMAAIPSSMIATTTTAATSATTTSAAASGTGKSLSAVPLWAILGPLMYFVWVFSWFFSISWSTVRNAPTLRARRFRVYAIFWNVQYYVLGTIALGVTVGHLIWTLAPPALLQPATVGATVFLIFYPLAMSVVLPIQAAYDRRMKGIIENDIGLPGPRVESYSYPQVERRFFLSLLVNILIFETILGAFVVRALLAGFSGDSDFLLVFFIAIAVGLLFGATYYKFGRYFLEICRTKENFLVAEPLLDNPLETNLMKTAKAPVSVDHLNRVGKMSAVLFLPWIAAALLGIWFLSQYSWSKHPISLALCSMFLIATLLVQCFVLKRKIKDRKFCLLFTAAFCVLDILSILALQMIEFGNLASLFSTPEKIEMKSILLSMHRILLLVASVLAVLYVYQWFKTGREESGEKKTGRDLLLQDAIARFDPNTISLEEQPEAQAKAFPKSWACGLGLYAAVILLVLGYSILFPSVQAQKYALQRKGDYDALIALEPDNAYHYLFRSFRRDIRTREERFADVDTAIRLKPDFAMAYLERARLWADLRFSGEKEEETLPPEEDMQRALDDCNTAIRYMPNNESCWETRSKVYEKLGNLDAAVDDLAQAIRLSRAPIRAFGEDWFDPRIFLCEKRAELNEKREAYRDAIEDCTNALKIIESDEKKYREPYAQRIERKRSELYQKLHDSPERSEAQ